MRFFLPFQAFVFGLILLTAPPPLLAQTSPQAVLAENFDGTQPHGIELKLLKHPNLSRAPYQGYNRSHALKVAFVGSANGSERITLGLPLPESGTEYTLNYDIGFAEDFQFVKGGKLPGFGPVDAATGGEESRPDTWSARAMFRPDGRLESYAYPQERPTPYGVSLISHAFRFEKAKWYAVSLHLKLNDPDLHNGHVHLYVDGKRIVAHGGLRLRANDAPSSEISQVLFHLFHGGHSQNWAPKNPDGSLATVFAWIDNLTVYRGKHIRKKPGF